MSKLRDKAEQKAKEAQDSDAWNKSTEYAESTISSTKTRFGKLGEGLGKTKERVSQKMQSTTESFSAGKEGFIAGEKQRTIISRFSSVRETVYSSTSSATKRVGEATRAMGAKTKEKLQLNTKMPNIGKMS